jgi:hypothetical protein
LEQYKSGRPLLIVAEDVMAKFDFGGQHHPRYPESGGVRPQVLATVAKMLEDIAILTVARSSLKKLV